MKPVRLYGDPFANGPASKALRDCLRECRQRGFTASICLSAVRAGSGVGAATVELGDGERSFVVRTDLDADTIGELRHAAALPVASTAPVLVFAPRAQRAELIALAGLEWSRACTVLDGCAESVGSLLVRVDAELRWAGTEAPQGGPDAAVLAAWAALPPAPSDGAVLHVGSADPTAGSDVALRAFFAADLGDRTLRIVVPAGDDLAAAHLADLARRIAGNAALARVEFVAGPLRPTHAIDCSAILQPLRRLAEPSVLPCLLASGRPVVATRYHATAAALGAPGTCMPIGGHLVRGDDGLPWCEPDLESVRLGLQQALALGDKATPLGERARAHAFVELAADRPAAPPARLLAQPRTRPTVVLEAPFFEVSSAAELSIDTARALLQRDLVDLRLVPRTPFHGDFAQLRARAPELERLFTRDPGRADLWLSSGWPPRAERPRCHRYAVRLDWEYGALPTELLPLVTQEADAIVVHSRHVERTVAAAGAEAARIVRIPHGVDAAVFHDEVAPDAEVMAWKGDLPLVLFVGGLVFRKGFDLLLRMALDVQRQGARFGLCVKPVGSEQHYRGFHLGELAQRFQATAGAPPLLLLDGDVSRARMAAIYRAADLLCHPYRGEGFGMPVLEARACGLPVLVTRGGATDDFAGGSGAIAIPAERRAVDLPGAHQGQPWLLEPDAVAGGRALAQALANLPELRAAAARQAPAVRAAHTWDAAAAAIEDLARREAIVEVASLPPAAALRDLAPARS